MVRTVGRRVLVRPVPAVGLAGDTGSAADDDVVCFLSGRRAVVGDLVSYVVAPGTGGKILNVEPRARQLVRRDARGRERLLAANLGGIVVVVSAVLPALEIALVDRYIVASRVAGIGVAICLNKIDQAAKHSHEVENARQALGARQRTGVTLHETSVDEQRGIVELAGWLSGIGGGAWAFVGPTGVGKTSLLGALLPGVDIGPIAAVSERWQRGKHTTTYSALYEFPGGGEAVDSPGVRTFMPVIDSAAELRDHFPGVDRISCRFRDCMHRDGDAGCCVDGEVEEALLTSYRKELRAFAKVKAI